MGIEAALKQISPPTLDRIKDESLLMDAFFCARWLPDSDHWKQQDCMGSYVKDIQQGAIQRFWHLKWYYRLKYLRKFKWISQRKWDKLKAEFLLEWKILELDLHKYWRELHFLLTGIDIYSSPTFTLPFLISKNSEADDRPLVNAIFCGLETAGKRDYGNARYLLSDEVKEVAEGLSELTEAGFRERYNREEAKEDRVKFIDWRGYEMIDDLTNYYNELTAYYRQATEKENAMLLYLC